MWSSSAFMEQQTRPHFTLIGATFPMKFIVFSDPIQFADDYTYANIIADDYYNKTGKIVAVEEVSSVHQFPSQNVNHYKVLGLV
tara:strand:- start:1566 stop:1817 length:252 start_codon:yes stop_codon:yes gene_type:complete